MTGSKSVAGERHGIRHADGEVEFCGGSTGRQKSVDSESNETKSVTVSPETRGSNLAPLRVDPGFLSRAVPNIRIHPGEVILKCLARKQ